MARNWDHNTEGQYLGARRAVIAIVLFMSEITMSTKKKLNLPRAPLPRQTGGYHKPAKGRGSYDRQAAKLNLRRERYDE